MTVKEALNLLYEPQAVSISAGGDVVNFNFRNKFEIEVWGDYVVRSILSVGAMSFELILDARPYKKEAAV